MNVSPALHERGGPPYRAVAFALMAAFLLSGCYTLLRHPDAADPTASAYEEDCLQCHYDNADPASYSYSPWLEYYSYSAWPWINYYGSPWWAEDKWVRCPDCASAEDETQSELSGRQAWVRRPRGDWFSPDSTRWRNPLAIPAPLISAPPGPGPAAGASQGSSANPPPADDESKEKEKPRKRQIHR